jgi:hypothetical protein
MKNDRSVLLAIVVTVFFLLGCATYFDLFDVTARTSGVIQDGR